MKYFSIIICAIAFAGCIHRPPAAIPQTATASVRQEKTIISYQGEAGKTALELLKKHARIRTAKSELGELVEEINGVRSNNGNYIFYYVNGVMAKTGAANYVTQKGDRIEWKLITRKTQ